MIIQCVGCGKRFVPSPEEGRPTECPRCRGQAAAAKGQAGPAARWVSSAPLAPRAAPPATRKTFASAPIAPPPSEVPSPEPAPPPLPVPVPVPTAVPAPAPASAQPAPATPTSANRLVLGWPLAIAGSVLVHLALLASLGFRTEATAAPSRTVVALQDDRTIALTRSPRPTLEDVDVPIGLTPTDEDWDRDLSLLPMGHTTATRLSARADQPLLAAATTVPLASATREPIELITAASSGPPARARFMGVEASGRRICIIADRSGSMRFQDKLSYLKREILKTVGELKGGACFYIVLFSEQPETVPANRWLGGKADVDQTERWLETIDARGSTDPVPAFRVAFKMTPRPDAVFFMTDGILPEGVPGAVLAMNAGKRRVPIHAISLIDQEGGATLRQIAKQSGGTYRHVPGF